MRSGIGVGLLVELVGGSCGRQSNWRRACVVWLGKEGRKVMDRGVCKALFG